MFCNYCGRELPKDAIFCHECGKQARSQPDHSKAVASANSPAPTREILSIFADHREREDVTETPDASSGESYNSGTIISYAPKTPWLPLVFCLVAVALIGTCIVDVSGPNEGLYIRKESSRRNGSSRSEKGSPTDFLETQKIENQRTVAVLGIARDRYARSLDQKYLEEGGRILRTRAADLRILIRTVERNRTWSREDQAKVILVLSGELEWAENGATAIDPSGWGARQ